MIDPRQSFDLSDSIMMVITTSHRYFIKQKIFEGVISSSKKLITRDISPTLSDVSILIKKLISNCNKK